MFSVRFGCSMSWKGIRPLSLGIARRDDTIFVAKLFDPMDGDRFYRPVGGAIEFGEDSKDALVREFREELGVTIAVTEYLGTVENIFTFNEKKGHEVILLYLITLPDGFAATGPVEGHEDDGSSFTVEWKSISTFTDGDVPLYPDGVLTLLCEENAHVGPES